MEMEKSFEVNPELEEMREQFRMLTEKVEKQNIVTEQLMREVSKKKIQRFEFWESGIFYILLTLLCGYGIVSGIIEGHPFWTSFSYIYVIILVNVIYIWHAKVHREYLSKIDYNLIKYWEDVEQRLQRGTLRKTKLVLCLMLVPILVHSVFVFNYMISIEDIAFLEGHSWLYIIILCLAGLLGCKWSKVHTKLIMRRFK